MSRSSARYAHLVRICRRRGCSREDARELVQEAYLRLFEYQRSAKVKDPDSLLRRIVINLSINYFHRQLSLPYEFEDVGKLDRRNLLPSQAPDPERSLAAEQEVEAIVSLLNAISERTCRIFISQRIGYSYEELASVYGVTPRTVEKHVAIAASALRDLLSTTRRERRENAAHEE